MNMGRKQLAAVLVVFAAGSIAGRAPDGDGLVRRWLVLAPMGSVGLTGNGGLR